MKNQIIEKLTELFKQEKKIGDQILSCLEQIEAEKIYAEMGYPSLFEMLVKYFGLNENSAYMRISAMRIIKSVPMAKLALQNNQVSVSTLSQVQSFIRLEEKSNGQKLDLLKKSELIEKIKNKSHSQVKQELTLLNPVFGAPKQKERILNEHETQVTFVIEQKLKAKLEKIKALTSHKNPNPSYPELFEMLADEMLDKLEKKMQKMKVEEKPRMSSKHCVTKRTRYIPAQIKKVVWLRDQGKCQYQFENKTCGSRHLLQMDHIKPYSQGGTHVPENLQLLCATHNQYKWDLQKRN